MDRQGVWLEQPADEPIDVARWQTDEEFGASVPGKRDKSLLYSPDPAVRFLVPNHRYLFKQSFERYRDQFWAEIIAYGIGCELGVAVPPTFVAWHGRTGICGALIEWFFDYPGEAERRFVPGGDIMTSLIRGYDRKLGTQHNFEAIHRYLTILTRRGKLAGDWLLWWCDTLLFDALIGNTDRHQDNWGLIWASDGRARMAPVFDNGTSLGHEIVPNKMPQFAGRSQRLRSYIERGRHHLRWNMTHEHSVQHVALIQRILKQFPSLSEHVRERLTGFDVDNVRSMMNTMTEFDIPVPLRSDRAEFVVDLTEARLRCLIDALI